MIGRRTWPGGGMGFVTVNAALSSESDRALMTGHLRSSNDSPTAPSSLFFVDKDLASYSRVPPPEPAESTHPVVISSKGRRAVTFCHATRNSQLWDVDACRPMGAPTSSSAGVWTCHPSR